MRNFIWEGFNFDRELESTRKSEWDSWSVMGDQGDYTRFDRIWIYRGTLFVRFASIDIDELLDTIFGFTRYDFLKG